MTDPLDQRCTEAWKEFATRYPDRAEMIRLAWLYFRLSIEATLPRHEINLGIIKLQPVLTIPVPEFADVVMWSITGRLARPDEASLINEWCFISDDASASRVGGVVGEMLLRLEFNGEPVPETVAGMTDAIVAALAQGGAR